VLSRRKAGSALERARQPALRTEACVDGDLSQRFRGFANQSLRPFDPALLDESSRCPASRSLERAGEVIATQFGAPGKVRELERPIEVGFDKNLHPL
jgi:hypothetical protein